MLNFRECGFTSKGYKNIWSHPQPHPAPCPVAQDHHAVSVPSQLCWDPPGGWILRWDDLGTSQSRRLLPDIISHPTISSNVKSDFCSKNIWISFGWVKNMWNHPTSNQLKIPTGTFQQWRTKMAPLTKMAAENLGTRVGVFFFFFFEKKISVSSCVELWNNHALFVAIPIAVPDFNRLSWMIFFNMIPK